MFKKMTLYRHSNCLDIDIFVCKVVYRGASYYKLKVKYWNRQYKAFAHESFDTIKIMRKDVNKWKEVAL